MLRQVLPGFGDIQQIDHIAAVERVILDFVAAESAFPVADTLCPSLACVVAALSNREESGSLERGATVTSCLRHGFRFSGLSV